MRSIRISFGIIVLNGEPFTRYCIRSIYPHAYQIIVAEGACVAASKVASQDGHSTDGTLELLREIKRTEDPENKILILTAEDEGHPNGFWPGEKHEQSQAYAKRATGNYLWQVDIDEFYKDEDIRSVIDLLHQNPEISAVSFEQKEFWGGFEFVVDSWYLRRGAKEFHRLFKWRNGYRYVNHRPPTIIDENGSDLRKLNWVNSKQTKGMGIHLYHYSYVFPKQIDEKVEYYRNVNWAELEQTQWWRDEVYYKLKYPYKAFINTDYPGWIERISVEHPKQIQVLISDLKTKFSYLKIRPTDDLRAITSSWKYHFIIILLKFVDPFNNNILLYFKSAKRKFKKILKHFK